MRKENGFSLVELLIVVAIIATIAAIAVPSLLTSKLAANEASAIQACRQLGTAQISFAATHNQQFTTIEELVSGGFLDSRFSGTGSINNYSFAQGDVLQTNIDGEPPESFGYIATPRPGNGRFIFAIAPDQVVRYQGAVEGGTLPSGVVPGDPIGRTN